MRPQKPCKARDRAVSCRGHAQPGEDFCHRCLVTIKASAKTAQTKADGGKKCTKCKDFTELAGFAKAAQNSDGLQSQCKACCRLEYFTIYKPARKSGGTKAQKNFDIVGSARLLSLPMGRVR